MTKTQHAKEQAALANRNRLVDIARAHAMATLACQAAREAKVLITLRAELAGDPASAAIVRAVEALDVARETLLSLMRRTPS